MTLPGHTAEVSLYRSKRPYGGDTRRGRSTAAGIVAQDCSEDCARDWMLCNIGCGAGSAGVGALICLGVCGVVLGICFNKCPVPGGGGVGGGGGCCPPGRRCCGSCATGRCDDVCVGPHQSCP